MNIIYALFIGLVVGAIAKFLMPGKDPGGFIVTSLLGVAGSALAFWIGQSAGWYRANQSGPGIIAAIIGALVLLLGYRLVVGRGVGSVTGNGMIGSIETIADISAQFDPSL